jgi:hypothetical protein
VPAGDWPLLVANVCAVELPDDHVDLVDVEALTRE